MAQKAREASPALSCSLLLRFSAEAEALGRAATLGPAFLEPLEFRALLTGREGGEVLLGFSVAVPGLRPHARLHLTGEAGVLDPAGRMWRARAIDQVFCAPGGRVEAAPLGASQDLRRYAAGGRVVFGLLVADAALLPAPGAPVPVLRRAFLCPGFALRRLRRENARLRGALREQEDTTRQALAAGAGEPGPFRALGAAAEPFRAVVARGEPAELRAARSALAGLLAETVAALEGAAACAVCFERPAAVLFVPCAHACCCRPCAEALGEPAACPLCRAPIAERLARA